MNVFFVMLVNTIAWRAVKELLWNITVGSLIFYLSKCYRCVLYSTSGFVFAIYGIFYLVRT